MKKENDRIVKEYHIPILGSLGLLALGDIGLKMWREKLSEAEEKEKNELENDKSNLDE